MIADGRVGCKEVTGALLRENAIFRRRRKRFASLWKTTRPVDVSDFSYTNFTSLTTDIQLWGKDHWDILLPANLAKNSNRRQRRNREENPIYFQVGRFVCWLLFLHCTLESI